MGDFFPPRRSDYDQDSGEKWDTCAMCDSLRRRALVHFDSGSVLPTHGETVTGATSGDTMVLDRHVLISGTYAGGDAVGVLEGTTPSGYDDVLLEIFSDNENLNGSVSGNNFATANHKGAVEVSGRLVPARDLIEYRGKKYCRAHFEFKYGSQFRDEAVIDTSKEGDRDE